MWLKLINKFSKVTRYNVNTEKSVVFPYANNKQSTKNIKITTSFTIASKE